MSATVIATTTAALPAMRANVLELDITPTDHAIVRAAMTQATLPIPHRTLQYYRGMSRPAVTMRTVSLKEGMPLVREALARLEAELLRARNDGVKLLKIVHGFGSKGVGGDIRTSVQAELVKLKARGELQEVVFGEDWRISSEASWGLLKRMPELKRDADLGRENRGITIVVL
jgi:hypothetical protein